MYRDLTEPEAVQANRAGQITPAQRKAALSANFTREALMAVVAGGILVPCLCIPAAMIVVESADDLALGLGLAFVAVPLLLAGVLAALVLRLALRLALTLLDLNAGALLPVDGTVALRRGRHLADFAGRTLLSASNNMGTTPPGAYRFYILPRSKFVLSAERV